MSHGNARLTVYGRTQIIRHREAGYTAAAIADGGGKRFGPGFTETGAGRHVGRGLGHDFIHIAIDDYSRYAYAEALPDERGETTAAFLERALAAFGARAIRVQRVLTD